MDWKGRRFEIFERLKKPSRCVSVLASRPRLGAFVTWPGFGSTTLPHHTSSSDRSRRTTVHVSLRSEGNSNGLEATGIILTVKLHVTNARSLRQKVVTTRTRTLAKYCAMRTWFMNFCASQPTTTVPSECPYRSPSFVDPADGRVVPVSLLFPICPCSFPCLMHALPYCTRASALHHVIV